MNCSKLLITLSGLTLASTSLSAPPFAPRCDIRTLSRNCAFFEERKNQKEITLPDGTSFPNPAWQSPETTLATGPEALAQWRQTNVDMAQRWLDLQAQAMDLTGNQVSPQFQLAFTSQNFLQSAKVYASMESTTSDGSELYLPWPPNDRSNQKVQAVTWKEFKSGFIDTLTKSQRSKWEQLLKDIPGNTFGSATSTNNTPIQNQAIPTETDAKRLKDLVDQARTLMLSEIDQGRSYRQLSAAEQATYDRVKSVQYIPVNDNDLLYSVGCSGGPNAFYVPDSHSFSICPSMSKLPSSMLIGTIAHELGHAIDPCFSQFGIHKVKKDELQKQNYRQETDYKKTEVSRNITKSIGGGNFLSEQSPYFRLAKYHGFVEELVSPKVNRKDFPYNVTIKCLQRQIGFRVPTKEMIDYEVNQMERVTAAQNNKLPAELPQETRRDRIQNADNPDCRMSDSFGYSESGEAMSDVWYAKVLGRYFETNPPKSDAEELAAFAILNQSCDRTQIGTTLSRPHPYNLERINQIILADHRVQNALGCLGDPKNRCLRTTGTLRTPKTSIEEKIKTSTGTR